MDGVHIDESWPVWKQFYTAYYPLLRDMCAVFLVCLVLFGVVFNIHTVSGSSMEPTFDSGTIIIGNHIAPDWNEVTLSFASPRITIKSSSSVLSVSLVMSLISTTKMASYIVTELRWRRTM